MSKHIDKLVFLREQLSAVDDGLPNTLTVGILVASIEVNALMSFTALIKTMVDNDLNWEKLQDPL